jgi:uncharacterized RDD family membrane protein YckC
MQGDLAILTPERAILTYRLASIGSRAQAHVIDVLVVLAGTLAIAYGVVLGGSFIDPELAAGAAMFLSFVLPILYFVLSEGLANGQTLGKRIVGLRVRMADGTPIGLEGAILRNLLRPADMLPGPYLVGLASIFLSERAQRLGDLAAGTVVITEREEGTRYAVAPHGVGIHPLESHVGPLRGLSMNEYAALRRLADRYYELPPEAQAHLIATIYRPVASRLTLPPPPPGETEIRMVEAIVMGFGRQRGLL